MGTTTKAKNNRTQAFNKIQQLQCRIVQVLHRAGNAMLRNAQGVFFQKNSAPRRILIFRTGSFGDSLCAIPAIQSIRRHFSGAQIHLLTNTGHAGQILVSIDQLIAPEILDRVINYQAQNRLALLAEIRQNRYDLIIQLPQYNAPWYRLLRDMCLFRFFAGIRAGFGWQWDGVNLFRQAQEAGFVAKNERRRLLDILAKNGIPALPETDFSLLWMEDDRRIAESILQEIVPDEKPLIGLVVGAKRPQNRWPLDSFRQVCRYFAPRFNLVLLGGPDDAPLAEQLQGGQPGAYSLCGRLSPMQHAWVLKKCRLVVSNDTGLMHLAYAVHAPLVALFSARDLPGRWYPPERANVRVIRHAGLACSACLSERCADNVCMKNIEAGAVIGAMEGVLAKAAL